MFKKSLSQKIVDMRTVIKSQKLSNTIGVFIAVLSIGITFFITGFTYRITTKNQAELADRYYQSLLVEIEFNKKQAESTIDEYKKSNKATVDPKYSSKIYESGFGNGYGLFLDIESLQRLSLAYSSLDSLQESIKSYPIENTETVRANRIVILASAAKTYLSEVTNSLRFQNAYQEDIGRYNFLVFTGLLIIAIAGLPLFVIMCIFIRYLF